MLNLKISKQHNLITLITGSIFFTIILVLTIILVSDSTKSDSTASTPSPEYLWSCTRTFYNSANCAAGAQTPRQSSEISTVNPEICKNLSSLPLGLGTSELIHNCYIVQCLKNCPLPTPTLALPPAPTIPPAILTNLIPPSTTPPNSPTPIPTSVKTPTPKPSNTPGGVGGGVSPTKTPVPPSPTKKPLATVLPSTTPTPGPGGGCGISCNSSKPCQSGFSCMDVGTGGNVCWNEGICGGPSIRSRLEGTVRGCSNEPLPNVKVFAWGNTVVTDSAGKYKITKGVDDVLNVTINETSILAGADATKNAADGYFTRNYDNLKLNTAPDPMQSCAKVNCLFKTKTTDGIPIPTTHKLFSGGPERYAYRIQKPMTDTFYKQNFVSSSTYAKSFDFKKMDCVVPTLTPPPIPTFSPNSCNDLCVSDAQCSALNSNWYCATQFSYYGWLNTSKNINTITYQSSTGNKTDSGQTTDLNVYIDNGVLKQHMVKSGRIYYRDDSKGMGLSPIWKEVTDEIITSACPIALCKITGFNYYKTKAGLQVQHIVRSNNTITNTFATIHFRSLNNNVWSAWSDVTSNVANVGGANAGKITSFTSYVNRDGYTYQTLVRGGRVFERHDLNGWGAWFELTNTINGCEGGDLFYGCGLDQDTILAYERTVRADNSEIYHLIRAGNKAFSLSGAENDQRCRVKSNIYSLTCNP